MKRLESLNNGALEVPPLNAMRAFEAAARLGGVAAAAAELGVTSGAVSQQIRLLETVLGAKLMMRAGRGVTLTAEGCAVAELIAEPFRGLREASQRLGRCGSTEIVRLGAPGNFASQWLAPRLARFEQSKGGFPVRLIGDPDPSALERFQIDLDVRFTRGGAQQSNAVQLLNETCAAVAAPALLDADPPVDWRSWLSSVRLIQCEQADSLSLDWRGWLARRAITREDGHTGDRVTLFEHAIGAAAAGRGLALVPCSLAEAAVACGGLRIVSGVGIEPMGGGYDLVWPSGRGLSAPGRTLTTFLLEDVRLTKAAGAHSPRAMKERVPT